MATRLDEFYIRLYQGNRQDEELAEYLSQFDNARQGTKPDKAKELMKLGLQALKDEKQLPVEDIIHQAAQKAVREAMAQTSPNLDQGAVRRAVQEAMRSTESEGGTLDFTLSDIRQVVSVVLDQKFDRLDIAVKDKGRAETDPNEQAKAEEDFAHLIESLKAF